MKESSSGEGGSAFLTIEGSVLADVTIPRVDRLRVYGDVSEESAITLMGFTGPGTERTALFSETFAGDLLLPNGIPSGAYVSIRGLLTDTASVDFQGQELAGTLDFWGGSDPGSTVDIGPVTGSFALAYSAYLGTATLASVEPDAAVRVVDATLVGILRVLGDWAGTLLFEGGSSLPQGAIEIGGSLAEGGSLQFDEGMDGNILIAGNCDGFVVVSGDGVMTGLINVLTGLGSTGGILANEVSGAIGVNASTDEGSTVSIASLSADARIDVGGHMLGEFAAGLTEAGSAIDIQGQLSGPFSVGAHNGDLCAGNLSATEPLPTNVQIEAFGSNGTICGAPRCQAVLAADPSAIDKNRFISFDMTTNGGAANSAIRVKLVDLIEPHSAFEGQVRWVGPPVNCLQGVGTEVLKCAALQCDPYYADWSTIGLVHVTDGEIMPGSEYELVATTVDSPACVAGLTVRTAKFGDVSSASYGPPDDVADILDIPPIVDKIKETGAGGDTFSRLRLNVDVRAGSPDDPVNVLDLAKVKDAVAQLPHGLPGPCACPSEFLCSGEGAVACLDTEPCSGAPCFDPDGPGVGQQGYCRDMCGRCTEPN